MPKTLQDLVRGIRNAKDEFMYVSEALTDIHEECKSRKNTDKVEAIMKLTFLYLLGYDIKQYAFNTIECISSSDPVIKRTGYLASNFSFGSPDMQTLVTNLYINDIKNKQVPIKMMALSSLASCPAPNREQVQTIIPILFEQLSAQATGKDNIPLLIKLLATTTRVLILAQRQDIEGVADHIPQFVEVIFTLGSTGVLTRDVILTQVYAHTALEIGRNFGQEAVMKLIPSLYDVLISAKQPWILIEASRFFGFMSVYDSRVKAKTREQFSMLLSATESKSLLMELAKATAEGFSDDEEMVRMCARRMGEFVIPGPVRSDANLKILALNNLAILEKARQGAILAVDGLASELLRILDDKDFNLRIAALDVIGNLCNQQFLQNIVNKLLVSLKDAKLQSSGQSLKELHQVSSSDVQCFKRRVVQVILESCSRNNYENVVDFGWFIDVLITLAMEYPQLSADECAVRILDLALKSDELRAAAPKLVQIILNHKPFFDVAAASVFDSQKLRGLTLCGPVMNQPFEDVMKEVMVYNKVLTCKFGSNQLPTQEIIDSISIQLLQIPKNGRIQSFFADHYFRIMDENMSIYRRPYVQEDMVLTTNSRVIQNEDMNQLRSISNLLAVCAWVVGSFVCYQPAADDSVNLMECLEMLLKKDIKHMTNETCGVFLLAAFKAFINMMYSYNANNLLKNADVASSCVSIGYLKQYAIHRHLSPEEIAAEERRQRQLRDARVRETDFTFMSDSEKEQVMAVPEIQEDQVDYVDSLVNMFVRAFDFLIQSLKDFSLDPGLKGLCSYLFYLTVAQAKFLNELVSSVNSEELRGQLAPLLEKYLDMTFPENLPEPSMQNIGQMLLQIDPEEHYINQRKTARPEFAFENGGVFSLDNPEGVIMPSYDMEEFQTEEVKNQQVQVRERKPKPNAPAGAEAEADMFSAMVVQKVEEVKPEDQKAQMDEWTGPTPKVKSVFMLDKTKVAKVGSKPAVQINKYTAGLKFGANMLGKKPVEEAPVENQAAPVEQPAPEKKRRRKHRGDEDQEGAQQEEQAAVQEQPAEQQAPAEGEAAGDLASLFA